MPVTVKMLPVNFATYVTLAYKILDVIPHELIDNKITFKFKKGPEDRACIVVKQTPYGQPIEVTVDGTNDVDWVVGWLKMAASCYITSLRVSYQLVEEPEVEIQVVVMPYIPLLVIPGFEPRN